MLVTKFHNPETWRCFCFTP